LYRDAAKADRLSSESEAFVGDVCDEKFIRKAIAGVNVIYHCAAAHSTATTDEMQRTTLPSLRALIAATRSAQPRPRIILMSSINVLGNGSYENAAENAPRRKTGELHVDLKIEAEQFAERSVSDGVDVVTLRPGLIYGPGEPHLPKLADAIRAGKFVFIGSRENIVPIVFVSDMVSAMILAAETPSASGRVYHVTDGSRTTIGQLVALLAKATNSVEPSRKLPKLVPRLANSVCGMLGKSGPVKQSAMRFLGSSRHVDISRARAELNYQPKVQVAEGIRSIGEWLGRSTATQSAA
jgi:nucleoside-diphosphate-sugar epimerase